MNAWFAERPDMVMGEFAIGRGRYGRNTLKVNAPADYEDRLFRTLRNLPEGAFSAVAVAAQPACQPVPVPAGLGEGSFLIEDGAILQIECGRILPVMHGQAALRAGENKMGRRLAALIELRDRARQVLRSQNEGWPELERRDARRWLNRAYDAFVPLYGPINRTTFSVNAEGNEVRRMPNLVRFREDPDAFLVMSLEEYDEATGKAAKSQILLEDVVGPASPVTSVATAEEGLLVSLNERGRVDPAFIAALYGKDGDAVLAELGELVFLDPETGAYETRDAYLSGNVRRKLAAARKRGSNATSRRLRRSSRRTSSPARSTPISVRRGFRPMSSAPSPPICSMSARTRYGSTICRRTRSGASRATATLKGRSPIPKSSGPSASPAWPCLSRR